MVPRVVLLAVGLLTPVLLVPPASGFEISRTRTTAGIATAPSGAQTVQLRFTAELMNGMGGMPDLSDDVLVGWQKVGGVQPQPFRILIPAGCFVARRGGFRVEDFRGCGVEMSVGDMGAPLPVPIVSFEARVVARDDGTARFDILTSVEPPADLHPPDPAHAFLGVLGGAAVEIAIGSEMSASPPLRGETVSGIDPEPF